jgi:hypothetical protein
MDEKAKNDMVNMIDICVAVLEKGLHLGENQVHVGIAKQFLGHLKNDVLGDFVSIKEKESLDGKEEKSKKEG